MTIIEMIDEIDRLVSNNGAVSEIKPFIIQVREQTEALQKRVRTLESKSKVKDLEGQVSFLREQLDATLKQVQEAEDGKQGTHGSDTKEGQTKVLLYLSANTHGCTAEEIAIRTSISAQVTQFHLDELRKKEHVWGAFYMGRDTEWFLGDEGRAHLFKLGLLK